MWPTDMHEYYYIDKPNSLSKYVKLTTDTCSLPDQQPQLQPFCRKIRHFANTTVHMVLEIHPNKCLFVYTFYVCFHSSASGLLLKNTTWQCRLFTLSLNAHPHWNGACFISFGTQLKAEHQRLKRDASLQRKRLGKERVTKSCSKIFQPDIPEAFHTAGVSPMAVVGTDYFTTCLFTSVPPESCTRYSLLVANYSCKMEERHLNITQSISLSRS